LRSAGRIYLQENQHRSANQKWEFKMSGITSAYINAILADASYENLESVVTEAQLQQSLQVRMTPIMAWCISDSFAVATTINPSDEPLIGSGFDVVVWQGKAGSEFDGQIFVSMRGCDWVFVHSKGCEI